MSGLLFWGILFVVCASIIFLIVFGDERVPMYARVTLAGMLVYCGIFQFIFGTIVGSTSGYQKAENDFLVAEEFRALVAAEKTPPDFLRLELLWQQACARGRLRREQWEKWSVFDRLETPKPIWERWSPSPTVRDLPPHASALHTP